MIDHVVIAVRDYGKSKAFYTAALEPLGYALVMEPHAGMGGFGKDGKPSLWIGGALSFWRAGHALGQSPMHLALTSGSRAAVDAFYAAALAAGGTDFGKPGIRALYHPSYYGAFVLDPDGNNVEAVTHVPE